MVERNGCLQQRGKKNERQNRYWAVNQENYDEQREMMDEEMARSWSWSGRAHGRRVSAVSWLLWSMCMKTGITSRAYLPRLPDPFPLLAPA